MRSRTASTAGLTPGKNRGELRSVSAQLRVIIWSALNRKCGAPHFRFNAEGIVTQTPVPESLTSSLFRTTFAPHKRR